MEKRAIDLYNSKLSSLGSELRWTTLQLISRLNLHGSGISTAVTISEGERMTDTPPILKIDGPEGETIFSNGIEEVIGETSDQVQSELDQLWAHYKDIEDDRLLSLVASLCIQESVRNTLLAIGPGFDQLTDKPDFTFALQINVLKALKIIPNRLTNNCHLIRQIRNAFAHELNLKGLPEINPNLLNKLEPYIKDFSPSAVSADHRLNFMFLVSSTILALGYYSRQIGRLREYLEDPETLNNFATWSTGHPQK